MRLSQTYGKPYPLDPYSHYDHFGKAMRSYRSHNGTFGELMVTIVGVDVPWPTLVRPCTIAFWGKAPACASVGLIKHLLLTEPL